MIKRYFSRKFTELANFHKRRLLKKSEFIYVTVEKTEIICHEKNFDLLNQVLYNTKQALQISNLNFDDYVKLVVENDQTFDTALFLSIISIDNVCTKQYSNEEGQRKLTNEFIFAALELKDFQEDKGYMKLMYISDKRIARIRNRADLIFATWLCTHKFGLEWQIKGYWDSKFGQEGQQGHSLNYKFKSLHPKKSEAGVL